MTRRRAGRWAVLRNDRGNAAVEAALTVPVLIVLVLLFIAAARLQLAGQKTDAAAQAAARAASLERTPGKGRAAAERAARQALSGEQQACSHVGVQADTSGLAVPVGQVSAVTVTVTCRVPVGDLVLIGGGPGVRTVTSSFTSVVDAYRGRG
ncbi:MULTISPECIES: TadE/TadG family type IV pilus assembly protein [unclassified Streptomyces]|uniref:TadE/TadG family type IV pilus assembly protein n=1 Tax=unclassified Streptomyces TaxID=2593676 RepID=UPI000DB9FAC8|nr:MULTISPECIES: TadE/TadG family type IV pilus assembly protein [unclassified Streptomyces]MYT68330.1 pilus assembly protein [Streptomyces sp. SID8367]RAJ76966.1 TadE-like protein [Streptomyces sp. PsTaAH-137]